MATLELRNETYRVVFLLGGLKYGYSLDTGERQTAEAFARRPGKIQKEAGGGLQRVARPTALATWGRP